MDNANIPHPNKIRRDILDLVYRTASPHVGSSFSCVEILISLYFQVLNGVSPDNPGGEQDRFILSKGHACPALYAVLAETGRITADDLAGFARNGGCLEQHPVRDIRRGIDLSTGSLGHGLSVGAGMALAAKHDGSPSRTFVLMGDGEMNEGSVWEAAMFAAQHGLDNLIAVVDFNGMQALGFVKDILDLGPFAGKWESFGWAVTEVDGHDVAALTAVFNEVPSVPGKPHVIVANTTKGKGVSFMENELLWHYRTPDENEYRAALKELDR